MSDILMLGFRVSIKAKSVGFLHVKLGHSSVRADYIPKRASATGRTVM